jgi:phage terminase Nu1 subunit (DNA packaging protein)
MTSKPPAADPSPLTKTAFARLMGVREATVREWCKNGMPVRADGKVNEAAARRWVEIYLDRARRQARTEGTSGGTVSDLRARKLSAEADLLEMNRRKRAGELVERSGVERAAEARGRWERESWVAWAARVASILASESGGSPSSLLTGLDREVRSHLAELSETVGAVNGE